MRVRHAFAAAGMEPSLMVATTTTASCLAPREMVKPPLIGQRSTLTVRRGAPVGRR